MKDIDINFIKDAVLKENIRSVHNDVSDLRALLTLVDQGIQDCLRKTMVVYIASMAEALLLWKIKQEVGTGKVTLSDEWKHQILSSVPIQQDNEEYRISFTKQTKEKRDVNKLDFNRLITLCKSEELLQKKILDNLDTMRKWRNKIHIGGLIAVTKAFPKKNVEFALEVLEETIQAVQ